MDGGRVGWLAAGACAGYLVLMAANPARPSLRDGFRCLRRYPRVWLLLAAFALAHSAFLLCLRVFEVRSLPAAGPVFAPWTGWQPPPWADVFPQVWLSVGESSAAIFNCAATTFPLSAVWAALFLLNWRGLQSALARGLRRRFGLPGGTAIHLGLVLCAVASGCKPLFFLGLPQLNQHLGSGALERTGEVINWLGFLFEYLLGVSVQIYLVLLCYAWLRGLRFDFGSLRRFALRRFVFVVKWASVVMIVSSFGINLPLVVASFQAPNPLFDPHGFITGTRAVLAASLLVFCAMQVLLIFHNESLRRAFVAQFRLWRRYGWHLGWFLGVVALHFFLLEAANAVLPAALGPWSWPGALWRLGLHPLLWSVLGGWFLVSWVCLFQRCERRRPDADDLIHY